MQQLFAGSCSPIYAFPLMLVIRRQTHTTKKEAITVVTRYFPQAYLLLCLSHNVNQVNKSALKYVFVKIFETWQFFLPGQDSRV